MNLDEETPAALYEEDPPLGLAHNESVCPRCRFVYVVAAGAWGVCSDCLTESVNRLAV